MPSIYEPTAQILISDLQREGTAHLVAHGSEGARRGLPARVAIKQYLCERLMPGDGTIYRGLTE